MKRVRKKLVIVGDGFCGKTSLLTVYRSGQFPEDYVPTIFENYIAQYKMENKILELALWDTAGQEEYDRLRPLSYPNTNVVLICFAVNIPASFKNILAKWVPEVNHYCHGVPKFLIATKTDLRNDPEINADLLAHGSHMLTYEEGEALSKKIGATYFECSAKRNENVAEIFQAASKAAMTGAITRIQQRMCKML